MTTIATSAEAPTPGERPILVWDVPTRVFHWLLVASVAGAWATAESEAWHFAHVTLGYTAFALLAFRLLWGLVGTRHARFASFVRGPREVTAYVASMVQGQPQPHTGHNPAGGWAIVGLIALGLFAAATGWAAEADLGGHAMEEVHEAVTTLLLSLAGLHVLGVVFGSLVHRENLVRAMWSGRKAGPPQAEVSRRHTVLGIVLLAAVLGFWAWRWQQLQDAPAQGPRAGAEHNRSAGPGMTDRSRVRKHHDHDHD